MGKDNCSSPSEDSIVRGTFNDWAAHKRLAIVNEIYAGDSTKAYNKLKGIITDEDITINKKYQDIYTVENWLHIFACSNSMRALKLENDDRRWLVPKITDQTQPRQYWLEFYNWLSKDNGHGKIKQWAFDFIEKHGHVNCGDHAPLNEFKKQVIEETLSADMSLVLDILKNAKQKYPGQTIIIKDRDLIEAISCINYDGRKDKMFPTLRS